MSLKENRTYGLGVGTSSVSVKPEPQEARLPVRPLTSTLNNRAPKDEPISQSIVKAELSDDITRPFLERGLPVPKYLRRVDATPIAPQPIVPSYTRYTTADDIVYSPEGALKEGLGMVKTLEDKISKLQLGSKMRSDVWMRELASLKGQTSPKTLIAVCGATGAGKSSILNAVLDDNVVPTSGMRACTATVTEIAYHDKPTIDADISFLSVVEWRQELEVLLADLIDEDGSVRRNTDLKSDAGIAWSKVHAVYPTIKQDDLARMSVDDIINRDDRIKAILGTTKTIVAKDSKRFTTEIAKYVDSKDQSRGNKDKQKGKKKKNEDGAEDDDDVPMTMTDKIMAAARKEADKEKRQKEKEAKKAKAKEEAPALWPLIRLVNVRCNAKALSTGAILVDLPGVADANAARNHIAKDYMKKCQCIWILAPITRAVDDKTARDLLGDAFKIQLMSDGYVTVSTLQFAFVADLVAPTFSDGNYDDTTITFIASKCDDVSCSEVISALQLEDDEELEEIQEQIADNSDKTKEAKKEKSAAERELKSVASGLKDQRAYKKEYEEHLKALKNGERFIPKLTARNKQVTGKKRKNTRGGKKGKSKRKRNDDEDEDESEESDDSDTDSDEQSDIDSDNDSNASASDDDTADSDADSAAESDEDGEEDDEEEETTETLKPKIAACKEMLKTLRDRQHEAKKSKKKATDQLATLRKQLTTLQKRKNAFCSLKRSEFSRDVLKEDFRTGLKDLDDSAAEERDPDNFDSSVNLRDYDEINLPVFTCSSRDYVRLKKQVEGDGDPTCFSNVDDTGIPALQEWCHQLTLVSRERLTKAFFTHLESFGKSLRSYVDGIDGVTPADREGIRAQWESFNDDLHSDDEDQDMPYDDPFAGILEGGLYTMPVETEKKVKPRNEKGIVPRLCNDFHDIVEGCTRELKAKFQDGLEEKCRVGAQNAAAAAVETSDIIASSVHWQTYRAMLRRNGSFRRDINEELLGPFTKNIAATWSKLFETDLFQSFHAGITKAVEKLLSDFEDSATAGLKDRAKMQAQMCLEEAKVALRRTIDVVAQSMLDEQKEISRCLAPSVQEELRPGYEAAIAEVGLGSVKRQKASFHDFVDEAKHDIFDGGAEVIMDRLSAAADNVGSGLSEALGQLAQKIEVNLAVLWETSSDSPQQSRARSEVVAEVQAVMDQVALWRESEKLKRERSEEERMTRDYLVQDQDVEMD